MPAALLDPRTIRELAAGLDLRPTKQRGQNFVHDANTVRRIVAAAELSPAEPVLEIGPGLGSLTLGLLEAGHPVTAIEIDDRLAGLLPQTVAERLPSAQLQVITADALTVTELPDPAPTALVANLPYNVSVPVLLTMFERFDSLRSGLVMVQAEVADRLAAPPGSRTYGVPSAKIAWYSRARRVGTVPPKVFWPVPNVESGLVRLGRHDPPPTTATRQQVFAVVDAAFAQRRKMLRSALSGLFGGSAAAAEALTEAGVDPQARGESIDIAGFARIAERIG
ncbi:16S rRNA (adenine(1518)-N(6)/adenine(1519)-N(6))-dimethyltransferase RsmA [Naumannella halotolerans]|uniref:16S rRNA (adenine(1518)-N(6)/adenine(1519)-N(6))- dimethyltransferase RsmA n=1 Tax=Naumannella halotolerans TaxID=993414 RepID=UPI00370D9A89